MPTSHAPLKPRTKCGVSRKKQQLSTPKAAYKKIKLAIAFPKNQIASACTQKSLESFGYLPKVTKTPSIEWKSNQIRLFDTYFLVLKKSHSTKEILDSKCSSFPPLEISGKREGGKKATWLANTSE